MAARGTLSQNGKAGYVHHWEKRDVSLHTLTRKARRTVRNALFGIGALAVPRLPLDDCAVAIVSYPKSGRTWIRALLGHALVEARGFPQGLPNDRLLDPDMLTASSGLKRTMLSHDGSDFLPPRDFRKLLTDKSFYRGRIVHFLHRDPKDILVSAWFTATMRANVFDGTLSDFIRSPALGIRKIARFHKIWAAAAAIPQEFHLVRYEQLHSDPKPLLRQILSSIGVAIGEAQLTRALEASSFARMRQMETSGDIRILGRTLVPRDAHDEGSYKTRRGIVGGYRDYMSESDIAYVTQVLAEEGNPFGAA